MMLFSRADGKDVEEAMMSTVPKVSRRGEMRHACK